MKLSAAMAMAPVPSESREREAERMDGRWVSAGWRGVHDGIDDLTSGPTPMYGREMAVRCCARSATMTYRARH